MQIYNFNAGPACLPKSVLAQIKNDIPVWQEGISILEFGHRLPAIKQLRQNIDDKLRRVLNVPDNFDILLLQGGAQALFGLIPLHFLHDGDSADYIVTGHWSNAAFNEAKRLLQAKKVTDSASNNFTQIEPMNTWQQSKQAKYTFYCDNETIHGIEFSAYPKVEQGFLVSDMTSSIAAKAMPFDQHGIIFASAQKNLGVAGLAVVFIRKDLIQASAQRVPKALSFQAQASDQSMINTPNVFAWYVLDLMLDWIETEGGVSHFAQKASECSQKIYDVIDNSSIYQNKVKPACRSKLNMPFTLPSEDMTEAFLTQAQNVGLTCLRGHRVQGGCRANIYNAMPQDGVNALVEFMRHFELHHA